MLEFPGGRGNGEIVAWKSMLERYGGNVDGVWEKENKLKYGELIILHFEWEF